MLYSSVLQNLQHLLPLEWDVFLLIIFILVAFVKAQRVVGIYTTVPSFTTVWCTPLTVAGVVCDNSGSSIMGVKRNWSTVGCRPLSSLVAERPFWCLDVYGVTPLAPCSWPPGTLLWTGLDRGCVLQPQKHIQAGTMASWEAGLCFVAVSLLLSVSLPCVYCVGRLTLAMCRQRQLQRTRSQPPPPD